MGFCRHLKQNHTFEFKMHRFLATLRASAQHDNERSCRSGGYFHRTYFKKFAHPRKSNQSSLEPIAGILDPSFTPINTACKHRSLFLACRSAVDQVTVNHSVVGSIPTTPANLVTCKSRIICLVPCSSECVMACLFG